MIHHKKTFISRWGGGGGATCLLSVSGPRWTLSTSSDKQLHGSTTESIRGSNLPPDHFDNEYYTWRGQRDRGETWEQVWVIRREIEVTWNETRCEFQNEAGNKTTWRRSTCAGMRGLVAHLHDLTKEQVTANASCRQVLSFSSALERRPFCKLCVGNIWSTKL